MLLIGIIISSNYISQKFAIESSASAKLSNYHDRFESYTFEQSQTLQSYLKLLSQREELSTAFSNDDKKALYENAKSIYSFLNTRNDITHFYFIKPDGKIFLRVHDYPRDSDIVERYTFIKAKQTQDVYWGLEFGLKMNYTLRVVMPWVVDGKVIGYLELGKEIDKILESLSANLQIEIYFAANKSLYENTPDFVKNKLKNLPQTKQHYVVYETQGADKVVLDFLNANETNKWIKLLDQEYIGYVKPLSDVSGTKLGKIAYLVNVSKSFDVVKSFLLNFSTLILVSTLFVLLLSYLYINKQERKLNDILKALHNEKEIVNDQYTQISSLLSLFEKGDSVLFKWNNDEQWSINYVSSNVQNLLGYAKEEFLNNSVLYAQCIHNEDLPNVIEEVRNMEHHKKDFYKHNPYRVLTKEGEIKWVLDYTVPVRNKKGLTTHYLGYLIDITSHENVLLNLEKFIDTQDNIVILTNGEEINFANKRFFTFLGYKNLEHFKQHHHCICEYFIENDRFFHLAKIQKDENWLKVIKTLPHSERIVSIMGREFIPHAFSVSINEFSQDLMIVSFADISQTILEYIQLEEKSQHDKLTKAYNREYFEQNFARYLYEYNQNSFHLGLAILDIDHFKLVNDTHGHDVGDSVLIEFVEIIQKHSRQDDILIRWGGEEFILLMKIKNENDLFKALDHLRTVVEEYQFKIVGTKTCSIGATMHHKEEFVEETIKRADEALYEAKNSGRNRVIIN